MFRTLKSKLIATFMLLSFMIVAVGAISLKEMSVLKNRAEKIIHEDVQAIRDLDELALMQMHYQSLMMSFLLTSDKTTQTHLKDEMKQRTAEIDAFLEEAHSHASAKEEKALQEFEELRNALLKVNKKVRMGLNFGSKQKAMDRLVNEGNPIDHQIMDLIHKFTAEETAVMEDSLHHSEVEYQTAWIELLGLIVAAVVISLVVATSMLRSISRGLRQANELSLRVADGDLTHTVDVKRKDEIGKLLVSLNRMVTDLRSLVSGISASSQNVSTGAMQISATSEQLQDAAVSQAAATEESSASMEEMTASISLTADNAQESADLASKAANDARKSSEAVDAATQHMSTIVNKIQVVQEIARQTDLLALNAAVEAARAGDHGRGFSVVASEVRQLAERSQEAALEISRLTTGTAEAAKTAKDMMDELVPHIESTADLAGRISAANKEMAIGMSQFGQSIHQLDETTQTNSASSEELSMTAEELATQASALKDYIATFKVEDGQIAEVVVDQASTATTPSTAAASLSGDETEDTGPLIDLTDQADADPDEIDFEPDQMRRSA